MPIDLGDLDLALDAPLYSPTMVLLSKILLFQGIAIEQMDTYAMK
jgi:hypothetical protein